MLIGFNKVTAKTCPEYIIPLGDLILALESNQFSGNPTDINAGNIGTIILGDVSTNDEVPAGSTYGNQVVNPSNSSTDLPIVDTTGTYIFTTNNLVFMCLRYQDVYLEFQSIMNN